jgi:hypothetical protein
LLWVIDSGGVEGVSSLIPRRPDKAEYYVIKDIWVDEGVSEKEVIIEVQGVRGDGSHWVTGFQVRMAKSDFERMPIDKILALIRAKAIEDERELDRYYLKLLENAALTESLKKDSKAGGLIGVRIDIEKVVV